MSTTTPDPYQGTGRAAVPGQQGAEPGRTVARAAVPTAPPAVGRTPGGGPAGAPPAPPALVGKRRRPRWRKVLLITALTVVAVLVLGAGGLFLYARSLESNMDRIEVFSEMTGERPAAAGGSLNILLLGSDSRDPDSDQSGGYRADTLMLMHVPSSRDQAYLISIPRDLWVYVPPSPDGTGGDHEAKVNAATSFGGVPLAVMTIEGYTGVRIDNVMLIDFAGFVEVTDALGGVEMVIEETIQSIHGERRVFEEGRQTLDGEEALDYIRQRYQFADGDFTRMRNQQQFLRSLMDKAASRETMTNPGRLNQFLQTVTSTLTVDEEFSLSSVAWKFRNLRGDKLTFLTSPHNGTGNINGESVVISDDAGAEELYSAVRADEMDRWVADNPDAVGDD